MNESDLIARARRGDEAAWEGLVREHQQLVFRLAYLLLGDRDEAEDVAQETFVRAFRAVDRFDASRPLRPWLLSIATNLTRNRRRDAARYLTALKRLVQARPEQTTNDGPDLLEREDAEALWRSVRRLRRSDQEVVYMRYFLEMSEAETASALGVPAGTVKSRLHRALARLRAEVVGEGMGSLRSADGE